MKKMLTLLFFTLAACLALSVAQASEPAVPVDEALVASLLPDYSLVEGSIRENEIRLLMNRPDGTLVFIGGMQDAQGNWLLDESSALPERTILGVENFVYSLGIPSKEYYYTVSLSPRPDGSWGISMLYPDSDGLFQLGRHWICDNAQPVHARLGDHPWSDISSIDWTALPASYEEAVAQMDTSHWAVVNNPNPADRLHLRTKARRDSSSKGKYYNRTPVYVIKRGAEWSYVDVGGIEGYMMTEYLAFGDEMNGVEFAGLWLCPLAEETPIYSITDTLAFYRTMEEAERFYVVGIVGETWYHVWLPDSDEFGYILQSDLREGNG